MICAELHCSVYIFNACNAHFINGDALVDKRNKNSVYNKAGSLVNLNGSFADCYGNFLNFSNHICRSVCTCDNLNKLHNGSGIKEMHADKRSAPISVIERDDVFVANIQSGLTIS